jgi:5-methylcytosine-specific restriction endonuclease McrA
MAGSFCVICRARISKGSRCKRHATKSPSNRSWHEPGAAEVRRRVLARDGQRCTRCGETDGLEVHHVIAAADGGSTAPQNLIALCGSCHREVEAESS